MPERDPRTEPRVGDVVRKRDTAREVVAVKGLNIFYVTRHAMHWRDGIWHSCWITTWRDWCKKADVIERGASE